MSSSERSEIVARLVASCTFPRTEDLEDVTCYICHEESLTRHGAETPIRSPCGHLFGMACLIRWVFGQMEEEGNLSPTCPNCRRSLLHSAEPSQDTSLMSDGAENIDLGYLPQDGDQLPESNGDDTNNAENEVTDVVPASGNHNNDNNNSVTQFENDPESYYLGNGNGIFPSAGYSASSSPTILMTGGNVRVGNINIDLNSSSISVHSGVTSYGLSNTNTTSWSNEYSASPISSGPSSNTFRDQVVTGRNLPNRATLRDC